MFAEIHQSLGERIGTLWAGYAVIFAENQKEVRPTNAEWVRWSVRPADAFSADITGIAERAVGLLFFQHFVPEMAGTRKAHAMRDKVGAMFNEAHFALQGGGVIRFERAKLAYAGVTDGWVTHNITVKYVADKTAVNAPP